MKDGSSIENAIVITANSCFEGVAQEYNHIRKEEGNEITLIEQHLHKKEDRYFDEMIIANKDNVIKSYFFDVTSFF